MPNVAQAEIVNAALMPWRERPVVERMKAMSWAEIVGAAGSVISAVGIVGGFVLWLSGAFAGATITADKLRSIEQQMSGLSAQMQRMQDQLNSGPRLDQLQGVERAVGTVGGRVDSVETQLRDIRDRLSHTEARQQATDEASRVQLQRR